jgi:hypothetical protein
VKISYIHKQHLPEDLIVHQLPYLDTRLILYSTE